MILDEKLLDKPLAGRLTISCEFPAAQGELCIADVSIIPK